MTETPLRRAARAVQVELDRLGLPADGEEWDRDDYASIARAVFQAIREPSEAMIEAWFDADLELPEGVSFEAPADIVDRYHAISDWKAMIDAAIAEG